MPRRSSCLLALVLLMLPAATEGQVIDRKAIALDGARKMIVAAEAEARRNKWTMAIAVVDEAGLLIAFEKMDNTQVGSIEIAIEKARTAARFKRSTKAFEDQISGGRTALLGASEISLPLQGGLPVTVGGQVIGAIGVSGGTSAQDEQAAEAGLKALTP